MATTPPAPTGPTLRQAPTYTLVGASRTLFGDVDLDGQAVRWEGGGVELQPLPCSTGFAPFPVDCAAQSVAGQQQGSLRFEPVVLWAGVECSPASWQVAEAARRAQALLLIDQHRQLEREFWTGDVADAENFPNLWLAMDGTVEELEGGTATGYIEALTDLQQELADCGVGRGMVHATVRTVSLWLEAGMVRRDGGLLVDGHGNVVVPGHGYPGTAPDGTVDSTGATAWAYASGLVDTRLGDIFVPEGSPAVVDRATNTIEVIAQRPAVAYFDGCCHLGINVDHSDTGLSGGSGGGGFDGGSP